ncbi:ABC transporter ATP-binding protein [Paeniglutamicibacter cryotolerans]|uniref:ABC-type quaternary amine transporter n=1 Tax=Paeniglutamicibacter cryotolerans TaxID=670079 RepID=A0A839QP32_9MICC|nr:ATP-binding cassette domain-containing protein [Paeniglutamicibacter cryotolerans]MBB2997363.1 osmoprotectant transport system ATP-binding protein [Paeniglutamicibacter cryotolerans]
MIRFEGVSKVYPDGTRAVEGLDLEIEEGSFTVLVGPSGCGKTTSMRMINRMVAPSSGRVLVNGRDVAGIRPVSLRLGIGYVLQNAGLFPHRTVADNVAAVLRLKGDSRRTGRTKALAAMERVGLEAALAERYPAQLSGGQIQRVGVARALAADPPILLMDEPFSAVDPIVRDGLQRQMLDLQAQLGKTIVMVTHDIDEALLLGDRIAVMAPGGVLAQHADARTVLTRPADEFVASLVAKDRGFRALSFAPLAGIDPVPLPAAGSDGAIDLGTLAPGWSLELEHAGASGERRGSWRAPDGTALRVTGSVSRADTLRKALDAVLASPHGLALVLDPGVPPAVVNLALLTPLLTPSPGVATGGVSGGRP